MSLDGRFYGTRNDTTGIIYFRGIRFADAPIGNLRWRKPVSPPSKNLGDVNATDVSSVFLSLHWIPSARAWALALSSNAVPYGR